MLSINTNVPSLVAQKSLTNSTKLLNQAIERMTTGFKINHASDNAANYSISTNMGVKISSYQVAEDNVATGLNMLSTASGSLDLITDKLSRLRALAEQSANGTYGAQSLSAINCEANAIVDEIARIYSTAEFNGIKLFGEAETAKPQFIEEVERRDTSTMTKLSSVAPTDKLDSGTYSISTAEELAQLAQMTNDGNIGANTEFVLANDIDLSAYSTGEGWTPIGTDWDNLFQGTFDGNGYVISNLYINRPDGRQGLFGYLNDGTIKNLGVENVNVTGNGVVGGLIAETNYGTITNCYVTGAVSGNTWVGGLVGWSDGTFTNCYATGAVSGNKQVGGLVGWSNGDIYNSYATGTVSGKNQVGGLVGGGDTVYIVNCYALGAVGGNDYIGGLVGDGSSHITNSYSMCTVSGNDKVGGLVGSNHDGTITNCYATGSVSGNADVGGLIGYDGGADFSDSYYNSETTGQSDTGKGMGVTTAELNALIANGTLFKATDTDTDSPSGLITFQVGINSGASSQITLDMSFGLDVSAFRGIGQGGSYLEEVDTLLNIVSAKQTEFGAAENRLDSALEEISTQYENLMSSRSTLRDADIAEVSSEYIRQQILQQASATLLATANQTPALALQLL